MSQLLHGITYTQKLFVVYLKFQSCDILLFYQLNLASLLGCDGKRWEEGEDSLPLSLHKELSRKRARPSYTVFTRAPESCQ